MALYESPLIKCLYDRSKQLPAKYNLSEFHDIMVEISDVANFCSNGANEFVLAPCPRPFILRNITITNIDGEDIAGNGAFKLYMALRKDNQNRTFTYYIFENNPLIGAAEKPPYNSRDNLLKEVPEFSFDSLANQEALISVLWGQLARYADSLPDFDISGVDPPPPPEEYEKKAENIKKIMKQAEQLLGVISNPTKYFDMDFYTAQVDLVRSAAPAGLKAKISADTVLTKADQVEAIKEFFIYNTVTYLDLGIDYGTLLYMLSQNSWYMVLVRDGVVLTAPSGGRRIMIKLRISQMRPSEYYTTDIFA
jgi:hypothetical protein